MSKTGFIVNTDEGDNSDIGDLLVRRDYFTEGGLWGCGNNSYGLHGDNSNTQHSSPVQTICGGTNWKSVSTMYYHVSAIKTDGTLWVWGHNIYGQLGTNSNISKSSPVQTISGGTNWKSVSCGYYHTTAIKTDGTLWGWGNDAYGQLGDNSTINRSSPVQTICGGNNWKSVDSGHAHTSAIKTDGTLWIWGYNYYGQLGDNTTIYKSSPVQTIAGGTNWKQVSTGYDHTTAIKTDGTLWGWGNDAYGQLGDNSTINRSSPVQTICGGTNWKYTCCGKFTTSAIKTDGTLWISGSGGTTGDNTNISRSSPVQTICRGNNWKYVNCEGTTHTAAIKTDGTLWLWGNNATGQLGDNTDFLVAQSRSSPIQTICQGTNWKTVSCGSWDTLAIKDDIS